MKVVGVGFGRTGTMSLKAALEQLGAGPCFHMIDLIMGERRERDLQQWIKVAQGEPVDWAEVLEGWEATVDWPGAARWREMCDAFPDAPVLLNVRDFDAFYASVENTILAAKLAAQAGQLEPDANRPPPDPRLWAVIDTLIWEGDFQGRFQDKAWVRQMYEARNDEIRETIAPDRLTVWTLGQDGWGPLAAMLGVDAPDAPFPRLHDTNEFRAEFGLPALA